jgi:hypothetical protein
MINLKRNDKLIIIVAVAVIILAAIGIAAYNPPENGIIKPLLGTDENSYLITWEKKTNSDTISDFAGKNTLYSETYMITESTGSVITDVNFQIIWQDDRTIGLLIKRGLDSLTAEIASTEMDGDNQTYYGEGSGNETLFFNVNKVPLLDSVEAEDISEAQQKIKDRFSGQHTTSFDVTVSVKTGEPLRRLFKFLRDSGNDFEIKITYDYYQVSIEEEIKETGSNGDSDSLDDIEEEVPPFLSMIIGTGSGRFI